ncbi:MAG: ABC transporter permease [Dehalococcoidia bacterium]
MSSAHTLSAPPIGQHEPVLSPVGQSYFQVSWRRLRRNHVAMLALIFLAIICLIALTAPWTTSNILHHDPNRGRLTQRLQSPSGQHLLGTDDLGRDVAARLISAGRVSLAIGFMVAAISLTLGVSLGLLAGFYGRWVDDAINAVIQVTLNIPALFILILLSVLFRPTVPLLALFFGLLGWPGTARQVRGRVLSERGRDYVTAARVAGARDWRTMYRHILPNVSSVVLVIAGCDIGGAILGEAGLSALGFGVQIPTASWGNMLSKSLELFDRAWWLVVSPGVAIIVTVFCVFLLADALRDALDPRATH